MRLGGEYTSICNEADELRRRLEEWDELGFYCISDLMKKRTMIRLEREHV